MLKSVRVASIVTLLIGCSVVTGCVQISPGYVVYDGANYLLQPAPGCNIVFTEVDVTYLVGPPASETDVPVWSVTFAPESKVNRVVLFGHNPDAVTEVQSHAVDTSRTISVTWSDDGVGRGGVVGVLDNLVPGTVLWTKGFEDAQKYADKAHVRFGC